MSTILAPEAAEQHGLRHVNPSQPGWYRRRCGKGFSYSDAQGKRITSERRLERLKSLAIPPAWEEVWICPSPQGHIQAVGRDAKGRRQYIYHPQWTELSRLARFEQQAAFAEQLPRIRARVQRILRNQELKASSREKVLACVILLLDQTLVRVGHEAYRKQNGSYGLTTLRNRHLRKGAEGLHLRFRGKSGVEQDITISDRRIMRLLKRLSELPGQQLFQYLDEEGQRHHIDSGDVNDYLRDISAGEFTAKDFRTWGGTAATVAALLECEPCENASKNKRLYDAAIRCTASRLGNTQSICRNHYVNPIVRKAFECGALQEALEAARRERKPARLNLNERVLYRLLNDTRLARSVAKESS